MSDSGAATALVGSANTFTAEQTVPDLNVTGLTGATAASRYVGATASGAPASGTFAVGDFVIDQAGTVWVCTVAGTPGAWVSPQAGVELGYAEITSQALVTRAGADLTADVAGLSITITAGARPFVVSAGSSFLQYTAAGGAARVSIIQGAATEVGRAQLFSAAGTTTLSTPGWSIRRRLSLAAGSYAFKVQLSALFANGTATLDAQTFQPAWLRADQV